VRRRRARCLAAAITWLALAPAAPAGTLKVATVVPEGSSWMQKMRAAAREIETRTDGRVELKFYPGGVMGNERTVLRKMRARQLQGGAFTGGALGRIFPDLDLYSLPLLFRSYAEVDYVRERLDPILLEGLERNGVVALAIGDAGFAHVMSRKPLREVRDLKGTRIWIQEGDTMSETAFEIAGVSPVQLPLSDVYTALQTGLVDTVAAPPIAAIAFQWHTKLKYVTDVPLMYLTGMLAVDARWFHELRPEDQAVLREVVRRATRELDLANREGEDDAKRALRQQGLEFVTASSPEELARWHDITDQALAKLRARNIYSERMLDDLHQLLAEYRAGHGRADAR
jgi:TRAP-type C4-dicarboxylate transport system substrate-binding protein